MRNDSFPSGEFRTDRDSSANILASADHSLTMYERTPSYDWKGEDIELVTIRKAIEAALATDYDGLQADVQITESSLVGGVMDAYRIPADQAEVIIQMFLDGLDRALSKTDWRKGRGKVHADATVPEVAASLLKAAGAVLSEAFSNRGMRAYRNRHHDFIEAMAEFAQQAGGNQGGNLAFYTHLGMRVAQTVLDHKITTTRPELAPSGSDYEAIEVVAVEQLVYFVQAGETGPIKIGIARDPVARLANLQTAHHETLQLRALTVGGAQQEVAYHEMFGASRLRGEWFSPHPEILAEIERLNSPACIRFAEGMGL